MKVWYQRVFPLGDPHFELYEQFLKKRLEECVESGTTVVIKSARLHHPGMAHSSYIESLNSQGVIDNAIQAEREGYDAFAVCCMTDPQHRFIRECVSIPVVFAFETSVHLACLLADKFTLLSHNEWLLRREEELVKEYGLWERYVPTDYQVFPEADPMEYFKNPAPLVEAITQQARQAVNKGASMLIQSCMICTYALIYHGIRSIDGIPILDSAVALAKVAELLVEMKKLGIDRGQRGLRAPIPKEEVLEARKLWGLE
jgi:allantoin racemase